MKLRKVKLTWEKQIKRQPRGHPDNLRRILQLVKGKRVKSVDGEIYIQMEVNSEVTQSKPTRY